MTTKELILKELEHMPEVELVKLLAYLQQLHPPTQEEIDREFLQTYTNVVEQRKDVFQRLADA